jgi:hypothetical protein
VCGAFVFQHVPDPIQITNLRFVHLLVNLARFIYSSRAFHRAIARIFAIPDYNFRKIANPS